MEVHLSSQLAFWSPYLERMKGGGACHLNFLTISLKTIMTIPDCKYVSS